MFKKVLALTLAAVMLLMPMTASAVTWNTIVAGLRSVGYYNDGTTTAIEENGTTTISGGEIDFSYDGFETNFFEEYGVYVFDNVTSEWMIISLVENEGGSSKVTIKDNANIGGVSITTYGNNSVALDNQSKMIQIHGTAREDSSISVNNNSELDSTWLNAYDSANVEMTNNGTVNDWMHVSAYDEEANAALVNNGKANEVSAYVAGGTASVSNTGKAETVCADFGEGGKVSIKNTGSAEDVSSFGYIVLKDGDSYPTAEEFKALAEQSVRFIGQNNGKDTISVYFEVVNEDGDFIDENGNVISWEEYEPIVIEIVAEEDEEEEPEPEPDPIELQRQAEGIGGVTTSPVWNWQGYLGHSSKPMWIYVNGEKVLMRQRLFWLGDSTKNHTCRINVAEPDPASIELRVGLDMLRTAQRAEISVISILDKDSNPIAQFAVSDLLGAFEQYGLEEGELLCVSADPDAEVMKVTLDGEYLPLEEAEEENAAA